MIEVAPSRKKLALNFEYDQNLDRNTYDLNKLLPDTRSTMIEGSQGW